MRPFPCLDLSLPSSSVAFSLMGGDLCHPEGAASAASGTGSPSDGSWNVLWLCPGRSPSSQVGGQGPGCRMPLCQRRSLRQAAHSVARQLVHVRREGEPGRSAPQQRLLHRALGCRHPTLTLRLFGLEDGQPGGLPRGSTTLAEKVNWVANHSGQKFLKIDVHICKKGLKKNSAPLVGLWCEGYSDHAPALGTRRVCVLGTASSLLLVLFLLLCSFLTPPSLSAAGWTPAPGAA